MTDIPTSPSAATRRVSKALPVADANDALIHTQKGSGWAFVTTVSLDPGQSPRAASIAADLAEKLGVRVEPSARAVFVYWGR